MALRTEGGDILYHWLLVLNNFKSSIHFNLIFQRYAQELTDRTVWFLGLQWRLILIFERDLIFFP